MKVVSCALLMALLAIVLSGCAGKYDPEGGSTAKVTNVAGDHSFLEGTAAITGLVVDDRGFPLQGAFVAVLGSTAIASTNATGQFILLDLVPGPVKVAFVAQGFHDQSVPVQLEPNTVTRMEVTMVPSEDVGPGYRTHIHDYWGDVTEMTVMDRDWDWNEPHDKDGPYAETPVQKPYNIATQLSVHACAYGDPPNMYPYFNNRIVWFDDESQLVYQGTGKVSVTITWDADSYAGPSMKFAYQSTGSDTMLETAEVASGGTVEIPLTPRDWDSSHQTFTLWDMAVCRGENAAAVGAGDPPVVGDVHVKMVLHRMAGPIPIEPAHPRFWTNGTQVDVIKEGQRSFGGQYALSRSQYRGEFVLHPDEGELVPPGSGRLSIRLDWTYTGNTAALEEAPWSITYRSADVWPYTPRADYQWPVPDVVETGDTFREYEILLTNSQTDAFYQGRSNWAFMLNHEGKETDSEWVNSCACTATLTLNVQAFMRSDFGEG